MLSLVVGIVRMALDFTYTAPVCGSGEPDSRPAIVREIDFLHFAAILAVFSAIAMAVISCITKPRPERKVNSLGITNFRKFVYLFSPVSSSFVLCTQCCQYLWIVFILCLVYPMLPVSLDCQFLIVLFCFL